jgi:uncharacterized membrane protein
VIKGSAPPWEAMPSPLILGKSRVEALGDGVFAIAMTLLVLKLEVPELMFHESNDAMLGHLLALGPAFLTYVVTFLIAGGFWHLRHLTFHLIRHVDTFMVWANLVFLMFVAMLPFSAGLMSHLLIHPVSQLFYFGNLLAVALSLNVYWHYAKRRGFTSGKEQDAVVAIRIGSTVAAFGAALITAAILPRYSWIPLPVCLLGGLIAERRWNKKKAGKSATKVGLTKEAEASAPSQEATDEPD